MFKDKPGITVLLFLLLLTVVVSLSFLSNRLWNSKPEKLLLPESVVIESEMTVGQFGQKNGFENPLIKEIFQLRSKSDLDRKLSMYGTAEEIRSLVKKTTALSAERESKNWHKIAVKFMLWFIFLASVFIYFRKHKFTPAMRKGLLFMAVFVFGIVLGSDPSPMGTVKDAVYLFATAHTFFPPRMIALLVFLLMVFLANKYICAWGCQAGTLQDLVFRLNRNRAQKPVIWKQFKVPFVYTNAFRVVFFTVFSVIAFMWSFDIIDTIDFFKVYKPAHLGITGGVFAAGILVTGLFIYRPWCHLFCPFGLAGWLVEKISRVRINVNYKTCIACKKCADVCPSTVMGAILLNNKKTVPDCFACYTCRDVCPSGSIEFSSRKRQKPPEGHFDKKNKPKITGN